MSEPLFREEYQKIEEPELRRGKAVRGKVITITEDSVVVNIGYKYDGLVPISEFGEKLPEVGEEIPVIIKKIDDRAGVVWLSFRSAERKEAIQRILEIKEKSEILKGKILRRVKGGYLVDLGYRFFKGILLDELSGSTRSETLNPGDEIEAYIDAIDFKRKRVFLDREKWLSERKEKEAEQLLSSLKVGQKIKGTVKNITDFGVFVNIGPVDALIRTKELSWKKISDPREVVSEGEEVEFVITSVDPELKKVQGSIRQAKKTRWHVLAESVKIGDIFEGTVKKKTQAGLYVWLMPGLDGLLPKEEFSKYIRDVSVLKEGEHIRVRVKSVNLSSRLIVLTHPTR